MTAAATPLERAFAEHRPFLWSLCYRLCGDAADAEDLVQETFVRALQHPPAVGEGAAGARGGPLLPWLVRVAINLGRDLLRRRRRRRYDGPWLPSPVAAEPAGDEADQPNARYDRTESVTMAFLLALEALSPGQRAVLLLRDVFDYSVREAAGALGMTEGAVKTTHLRARRRMATYDSQRVRPTRELQEATRRALERFLLCLQSADASCAERLLAEGVVSAADGGGTYAAARDVIGGRARVAALYAGLASKSRAVRAEVRLLNGLPALVADLDSGGRAGWAPRTVMQVELDEQGLIRRIYSVVAPRKLTAVD